MLIASSPSPHGVAAGFGEPGWAASPLPPWRHRLPTLDASCAILRELRRGDAASLLTSLTTREVARFISPPPTRVEGFERFIVWAERQRAAGQYLCFGVVPRGAEHAVGLYQVRPLEPGFTVAEWGFALAADWWGSGLFVDGAVPVVDFAFGVLGVDRLEARAAVRNGRGNGALRKLGAVQEAVLRRSFRRGGEPCDQALWTILADEWLHA